MANAESLFWPLPDSRVLTGGYADSRPDHFHGGVDLRTSGQELPVVAPTDGWIERMAVTPPGYGRTLYFRLNDGRTAVFAHLSRFAPCLEQVLRDSQRVSGTYRVDCLFEFEECPCAFGRGDTLAYTGKTGIGPPHLHFEIREGAVQTDPLKDFPREDSQPPTIVEIRWTGLSSYSPAASGSPLQLAEASRGVRRAAAIRTDEPVAFFIQCFDRNSWGRNAVPSLIRVKVGSEVVFEDRCAWIDLKGRRNIYERIVWAERKHRNRDLRRLFTPPPSQKYLRSANLSGWLSELERADVRIEVLDRAGNISAVELKVSCGKFPNPGGVLVPGELSAGSFTLAGDSMGSTTWAQLVLLSETEIRVAPSDMAFGDRMRLTYHRPSGEPKTGCYFYEVTAKGVRKPLWPAALTTDSVSCLILRGGTYGVALDSIPPSVSLFVKGGAIHFRLMDSQSGVDDTTIRCTVDGQTCIPEFEYEERGGSIWSPAWFSPGSHEIAFTAGDRAGNVHTTLTEIVIP